MPEHIGKLPQTWNADKILQEVLQHYVGVLSPIELQQMGEWWGTKQVPEIIVFCTNSTRKAIMFALLAKMAMDVEAGIEINVEDYFPHTEEEPLNAWLTTNVANGDGALKIGQPLFIGHFFGVQMWIQPTKGESEKNDQPSIEATSKAMHGREEWLRYASEELKGKKTVLVGVDTVEHVTLPDGGRKIHGKPIKDQRYPHQEFEESAKDFAARIDAFHKQYIEEGYPVGAEVEHLVAVAFYALAAQTIQGDRVVQELLPTRYTVSPNMFDAAKIDPYAGGAGLTQQVVELFSEMSETQRIAMFCQIMGAPLVPILEMIRNALPEKGVDPFDND